MRLRQLLVELRRRKVFRASALYIVAAWAAVQVADQFFPAIGVPEEAIRYVWLIVAFLFPLAVIFAWRFDSPRRTHFGRPPVGTSPWCSDARTSAQRRRVRGGRASMAGEVESVGCSSPMSREG